MRWKCICAYDGTDFDGWQRQPGGGAVQNTIEAALGQILDTPVRIHGSGRTDAGAHARGQCFHFDAEWPHRPSKLIRAIHANTPTSLQIRSLRRAAPRFHARHSAVRKRYVYRFYLGRADPLRARYLWACPPVPLDLAAMRGAAARLTGTHDFTAFGASHGKDRDPEPIKTVHRLTLAKRGNHITLVTEGSGYLYRMVRSLAGALYSVGRGKLTPGDVARILESRERTHRVITAPAKGLCLEKVFY